MTGCLNSDYKAISPADPADRFVLHFPMAGIYTRAGCPDQNLVREAGRGTRSFPFSERHLQAVWYDSQWRPERLETADGQRIRVEYPGRWNLEAGPDFIGATLVIGSNERRITGDVEIHISPADWMRHGHQHDKRYRNVCLHVTYFDGTLDEAVLPPGTLQLALRSPLHERAMFAFEQIDVSMYPYAGRADLPPCRSELANWDVGQKAALLEAAGQERMRRKAARFAAEIETRGVDQVFYRSVLSALGYQHNRLPFQRLAELLPLDRLGLHARGNPLRAFVLLAGVSGLLPESMEARWDVRTRQYVRGLWDIWWKEKSAFPVSMAKSEWRLNGVRPLNHPLRRMMAAAHLFSSEPDIEGAIRRWSGSGPSAGPGFLTLGEDSYWSRRNSLGGSPQKSPVALLGTSRRESILLNVAIPMAAALGVDPVHTAAQIARMKPEPVNQIMKQAVFYLFGPDVPSSLYASSIQRQGLMQIFHDYCIQDRSRCSQCGFPAMLARLARKPPADKAL